MEARSERAGEDPLPPEEPGAGPDGRRSVRTTAAGSSPDSENQGRGLIINYSISLLKFSQGGCAKFLAFGMTLLTEKWRETSRLARKIRFAGALRKLLILSAGHFVAEKSRRYGLFRFGSFG